MPWPQENKSSHAPPILIDRDRHWLAVHFNGMEALRFIREAGLGAIKPDGGGGIGRGFGVSDFAGDHDAALDSLSQHRLTRFRVLVPAERFARQEGIAEPLERNKGMAAALGFGQCPAQFLDAGIE